MLRLRSEIRCFASEIALSHPLKDLPPNLLNSVDTLLFFMYSDLTMAEGIYRRKDADYWRKVEETARERLAELRAERDEKEAELEAMGQEIVKLERLVESLYPLAVEVTVSGRPPALKVEGVADLGLADALREILKQGNSYRTARGLRDSLEASDYRLEQHSNPLASIHGLLKRFVERGDVEQLETEGKTRYRWKVVPAPVSLPRRRSSALAQLMGLSLPEEPRSALQQFLTDTAKTAKSENKTARDNFLKTLEETTKGS